MAARILSIDFGMARLGLALSDERCIVALPYKVIPAGKKAAGTVKILLAEIAPLSLKEIVVGLPLLMNGKRGLLADEVEHFSSILRSSQPLPVSLWDERLTTVQAERSLREGTLSRKKRTQRVDTVSAVLLLQSYLDYLQNTIIE